jgi:NAD(P)-dependent dehydrogenase (short-subunit alcohol dehydrogenase family)
VVSQGASPPTRNRYSRSSLLIADAFGSLDVLVNNAGIAGVFGSLDVLVNNAGIAGVFGGQPSQTSLEELRTILETNVLGVIAVTNAVLPLLLRAPAARVVNVSSEIGSVTFMCDRSSPVWGMPASISYPASKSMLNMVTAMYAKELSGTGVKVNAANPGYCATDLNGHNGFRSAAQGAEVSVHLATLPHDGPTGTLWGYRWGDGDDSYGELPW